MRKKIIIVFRLFFCRADSITTELCQTRFVVWLENTLPSAVRRNNCFPGALQFWHFTSNGQKDRLPCRRTKNLIITESCKLLVMTPDHPPHYHFSKTMYFISRSLLPPSELERTPQILLRVDTSEGKSRKVNTTNESCTIYGTFMQLAPSTSLIYFKHVLMFSN